MPKQEEGAIGGIRGDEVVFRVPISQTHTLDRVERGALKWECHYSLAELGQLKHQKLERRSALAVSEPVRTCGGRSVNLRLMNLPRIRTTGSRKTLPKLGPRLRLVPAPILHFVPRRRSLVDPGDFSQVPLTVLTFRFRRSLGVVMVICTMIICSNNNFS